VSGGYRITSANVLFSGEVITYFASPPAPAGRIDIAGSFNGNATLENADFDAPADAAGVGILASMGGSGTVYVIPLEPAALAFVKEAGGRTQLPCGSTTTTTAAATTRASTRRTARTQRTGRDWWSSTRSRWNEKTKKRSPGAGRGAIGPRALRPFPGWAGRRHSCSPRAVRRGRWARPGAVSAMSGRPPFEFVSCR
jgi:hypothetical protein